MTHPIQIREIEIRECRYPAEWRGTYTSGNKDPAESVRFFARISDGEHSGHGECIPTSLYYKPGDMGRSDIDEWAVIHDLAEAMLGRDARALGSLIRDDFENEDANSIRDVLDFAVHDLAGQSLGVPAAAFLGGFHRREVTGIPVIHTDTIERMADQVAKMHRDWGFRYFKLKPHGERDADVRLLERMRALTSDTVRFYMDANYHLKIEDPDAIIRYMDELHGLGLEVYEDPIKADHATLRYIRERTKVRIMIDVESRTPAAVLDIIRERSADQINIHANWAGGFQAGIRKAWLAWQAGMPTMVGSCGFLGPAAAAYLVMASVLPCDVPCEQGFREVFGRTSLVTPFAVRDGKWILPDAPGLGIDFDMRSLDDITTRRSVLA